MFFARADGGSGHGWRPLFRRRKNPFLLCITTLFPHIAQSFSAILQEYLPPETRRMKVPTARTLLVLIRNVLVSREPIYGIGEWTARHAPDLFGLCKNQVEPLQDDRLGRCLDRLFRAATPDLLMA